MNARATFWATLCAALLAGVVSTRLATAQPQTQAAPRTTTSPQATAGRVLSPDFDQLARALDRANYNLDLTDAWIRLGEAREADLREGRMVAVVGEKRTVFIDRSALRRSLQRTMIQTTAADFTRDGDYASLRDLGDAAAWKRIVDELESDVLRESENYRQWIESDLIRSRRDREQIAKFLSDAKASFDALADRWDSEEQWLARRQGREPRQYARAADLGTYPQDLRQAKEQMGKRLDDIRKAGNWIADHHFQVGTLIGLARTVEELSVVEKLMRDYAACYDTRNLAIGVVRVNNDAKLYPTPGDRVRETNRITDEFNGCMGRASAAYQEARRR
jgi:hypothetical protein